MERAHRAADAVLEFLIEMVVGAFALFLHLMMSVLGFILSLVFQLAGVVIGILEEATDE